MIYTLQDSQSFDAELLRLELCKAIGETGWHINTAGNTVEFVSQDDTLDPTAVIEAHFNNGAQREHRKSVLKQISDLEATVTPRRVREAIRGSGKQWLDSIDDQIAALRSQL